MGFPFLTIIGFTATIIGHFGNNHIIFLLGLMFLFIAMALMARGGG